jgi:hypothetical protein
MTRPVVGSIFDPRRRGQAREPGRQMFANSDVSGLSTFDEAQYRGMEAADKILQPSAAHSAARRLAAALRSRSIVWPDLRCAIRRS